uniref:Putative Flp pilus-assembly TadG-like N-terminal domain-containing protein n=1 Tax=uncultured prokaryote TaxID=198431 RepID=A0A0H5Q9B9_9ZZZZ|nr:hypothetical protein [uncultured prokaryote]
MKYTNPTVFTIFCGKCRELFSDSKGAAAAITLAFVMPVYLLVIGIYGIGEIVRNKIELQNAADAAAYSASVVQADYLSRIATVNKAMAWTYVDLQKRSLDLAMDVFCKYVFIQFQKDFNMVRQKNSPCHMHVPGVHYNCGTDIAVFDPLLLIAGTGVGIPELANGKSGKRLKCLTVFSSTGHATVAVSAVDGKSLQESTRIVLIYNTEAINSGMEFTEDWKVLHSPGRLPVLARTGTLRAEIAVPHGEWRLYALGLDGSRREELPVENHGGRLSILLDTAALKKGVTPFFELCR